jgi:hypothetical protein
VSEIPEWLPAYVRELADGLGLKDWTFEFHVETLGGEGEETVAEVRFAGYRKHAGIILDPVRWPAASRDWKREVLVHELVHCHINPIYYVLTEDICDGRLLNQSQYNMAHAAMKRQVEYATDGIAAAIACHYPLPPEETHETQDEHGAGADAGV